MADAQGQGPQGAGQGSVASVPSPDDSSDTLLWVLGLGGVAFIGLVGYAGYKGAQVALPIVLAHEDPRMFDKYRRWQRGERLPGLAVEHALEGQPGLLDKFRRWQGGEGLHDLVVEHARDAGIAERARARAQQGASPYYAAQDRRLLPPARQNALFGDEPQRGDIVEGPGGIEGRYVGTAPGGFEWVAWDPEDFDEMCATFDDDPRRRAATGPAIFGVPVTAAQRASYDAGCRLADAAHDEAIRTALARRGRTT